MTALALAVAVVVIAGLVHLGHVEEQERAASTPGSES